MVRKQDAVQNAMPAFAVEKLACNSYGNRVCVVSDRYVAEERMFYDFIL